ncbi:hypothetical protein, partial [Caldibacillus debilis]|uniref:hypothetical protein n=1 Tax=Caldibacillus debilis TaxID=301148 RepID=UPI0023F09945
SPARTESHPAESSVKVDEPPSADPHARWCEGTGVSRPLLLDLPQRPDKLLPVDIPVDESERLAGEQAEKPEYAKERLYQEQLSPTLWITVPFFVDNVENGRENGQINHEIVNNPVEK